MTFFTDLPADVRYAGRMLRRAPAFATVATLTLALGIGANTAIFSVVYGVLLRALPYGSPDRIVKVWRTSSGTSSGTHNPGDFLDLTRENRGFSHVAGYREDIFDLSSAASEPERYTGLQVTSGFFDVFGVQAALGRGFQDGVDVPGTPLVVLSDRLWRRLGADQQMIGTSLRVNGSSLTVVGVMPPSFQFTTDAELWALSPQAVPPAPIAIDGDLLAAREVSYFDAVARLRPGVSIDQAGSDLATLAAAIAERHPKTGTGRGFRLVGLHEQLVGDVRTALLVLLGAVGFVLLIACANVANLMLARGTVRRREIGVRTALGAGRVRLIRQLLAESLLLSGTGAAAGLVLAVWGLDILLSVVPADLPRVGEIRLDGGVLVFTVLISMAAGILFGIVPAWQVSGLGPVEAIREAGARAIGGLHRTAARRFLLVVEVGLSLVLLTGAGLMARSFVRLRAVDPGFRPDSLVTIQLALPQLRYKEEQQWPQFYDRLLEGLTGYPATGRAAVGFPLPLSDQQGSAGLIVEGRPEPAPSERPVAQIASVSPGYLSVLGVPLLRGRDFSDQDRHDTQSVVIVSAGLANRYWHGEDAVGKRIKFPGEGPWFSVVGVAGDTRRSSLASEPRPTAYLSHRQFMVPFVSLVIRTDENVDAVAATVRTVVRRLDPDLPIDEVKTMERVVADSLAQPRFRTVLLLGFAGLSMLLAGVGVYGLVSFSVSERAPEIGIRIALGATPRQVLRMVVREGLVLSLAGVGVGLVAAALLTRVVAGLLFGIEATDGPTFAAVAALLVGVTLLASYLPARRATRVDPMSALRSE
jgi:putative ABC transport system permease protein